jgi:hypothetical protein
MINLKYKSIFSVRVLITAMVFGGLALVILLAQLTIPIPGTTAVTDPRELFAAFGAALTGPAGGLIVGILAAAAVPQSVAASVLGHILAGLWMGLAYKELVYERLRMPFLLLGWAGLIQAYYFIFLAPGFVLGLVLFYGEQAPLQKYLTICEHAWIEALFTTLVTLAVLAVLPKKYRKPLW